jgi:hypothetical protein
VTDIAVYNHRRFDEYCGIVCIVCAGVWGAGLGAEKMGKGRWREGGGIRALEGLGKGKERKVMVGREFDLRPSTCKPFTVDRPFGNQRQLGNGISWIAAALRPLDKFNSTCRIVGELTRQWYSYSTLSAKPRKPKRKPLSLRKIRLDPACARFHTAITISPCLPFTSM